MEKLAVLIEQLEKGRNIHICIDDLNGILNTSTTELPFEKIVHSKKFCNIAKFTKKGYHACLTCKLYASKKSLNLKSSFVGQCFFGLYEATVPVIIDDSVAAVVYVGNAIFNLDQTKKRIKKSCKSTGISESKLLKQLNNCEYNTDANELYQIGHLVADYLKILHVQQPKIKNDLHWLVSSMKRFADKRFCHNISIKEIALTYQKSEQYLGRLFKNQMGVSFNDYYTQLRLEKAENLLINSDDKIINIAMDCGFNNISYFNRIFQKKHHVSPSKYRNTFNNLT